MKKHLLLLFVLSIFVILGCAATNNTGENRVESALQMHQKGIIVCDEDATVELKYGTVKYFKDIESANLDQLNC